MIKKRDLLEYGFNSMDDYFDYIYDSQINGQHSQVLELFNAMSITQKANCIKYFGEMGGEYYQFSLSLLGEL